MRSGARNTGIRTGAIMDELNEFLNAPVLERFKYIAGTVGAAAVLWLFCWVVL